MYPGASLEAINDAFEAFTSTVKNEYKITPREMFKRHKEHFLKVQIVWLLNNLVT